MKAKLPAIGILFSLLSTSIWANTEHTLVAEQAYIAPNQTVALAETKRAIAKDISSQYGNLSAMLKAGINQYDLSVSTEQLLQTKQFKGQALKQADASIRSDKGLAEQTTSLVELRLADQSMLAAWQEGEAPLFAFAPDGNDTHWDAIEAYDVDGNIHYLDVYTLPERPVFVVGIDSEKSFKAGLEVMKMTFSGTDMLSVKSKSTMMSATADEDISTTVIKKIRLNDDQEPWISGAAEVYAIVTGVNPSRDEPVLDIVDMPYLDYDGKTYSPNQIAIYWDRYRWAAADVLLMEHDDNTNYKALASALLEAATQIMRLIPDPAVQGYAIIPQITNGILKAMPDEWFSNDDDYVDVFYTLFEGQTYNDYMGASGNAKVTLSPLVIAPRN